jgi:hypothetical protein
MNVSEKLKLTSWLVNQRILGNSAPRLGQDILAWCKRAQPLTVSIRRDRLLQYIAFRYPKLDDVLVFKTREPSLALSEALAWTESSRWQELEQLLRFSDSFVSIHSESLDGVIISLSFLGFERVEALAQKTSSSSQAFVAMWFDDSMREAFEKGFQPAIATAGYTPLRIDRKEHNNKIDDEIVAEIRRSRFVVADFTCPCVEADGAIAPIARGGVYYEAGFAQGLGLPVIWTCRKDMLRHVHFDTRQYAHIDWENAEELKDKLSKRISATLGDGPRAHATN